MTETPTYQHHFTLILAFQKEGCTPFPEPELSGLLAEMTEAFLREDCDLPREEAFITFTDRIERGFNWEYHIHIAATHITSLNGLPLATAFLKTLREKGCTVPSINVYLQTPQGKAE